MSGRAQTRRGDPYVGEANLALDVDLRGRAEAQDTAARLGISLTSVATDLVRKWTYDNRPTSVRRRTLLALNSISARLCLPEQSTDEGRGRQLRSVMPRPHADNWLPDQWFALPSAPTMTTVAQSWGETTRNENHERESGSRSHLDPGRRSHRCDPRRRRRVSRGLVRVRIVVEVKGWASGAPLLWCCYATSS